MIHLETKSQRKERLLPYLDTHATCPTTDGQDLEVWEELKAKKIEENMTEKEGEQA